MVTSTCHRTKDWVHEIPVCALWELKSVAGVQRSPEYSEKGGDLSEHIRGELLPQLEELRKLLLGSTATTYPPQSPEDTSVD